MKITNPVLKGFNPDPSAINVSGTIYVAVSTFQWMPGVTIYKTNDLLNYELVTSPVNIDLSGHPADTTIWAPNLSYYKNMYYLVYTVVTSTNRPFKDMKNYLITATNIEGPWSRPIYLNSNGFDPSLYHDDKHIYISQTLWDYRIETPNKSAGIIMQKLDRHTYLELSDWQLIFNGTKAKKTEASNIYYIKEEGYYYLITAEGGTGRTHQVTVARSKNIFGPYEVDPNTPLMTASGHDNYYLQCAGHASLVKFMNKYYIYYLTKRLDNGVESILGRETSLAEVEFSKDGWLTLKSDNLLPPLTVNSPVIDDSIDNTYNYNKNNYKTNFKKIDNHFQMPFKYNYNNIRATNEGLKIRGMASIQSTIDLNMVAYKIKHLDFEVQTKINYHPLNFQQMAGISLYLNHENFIFLYITSNGKDKIGKIIFKNNNDHQILEEEVLITSDINELKLVKEGAVLSFYINDQKLKTTLNPLFLNKTFSGTMIGLSAHDFINYNQSYATFKTFNYKGGTDSE